MNLVSNGDQPALSSDEVYSLIELIDSLIAVVCEENVELAKGIPASRSTHVDRKRILADQLETTVAACSSQGHGLVVGDKKIWEELMVRITCLREVTDENIFKLKAAIDVSGRRIDAVMQAIRQQISSASPYDAGGRRAQGQGASCATNLRA